MNAPFPRDAAPELIQRLRSVALALDWGAHVPRELQSARGYLTGEIDRSVFSAVTIAFERLGRTRNVRVSLRDLARWANVAHGSVKPALMRMQGWLLSVEVAPKNDERSQREGRMLINLLNEDIGSEIADVVMSPFAAEYARRMSGDEWQTRVSAKVRDAAGTAQKEWINTNTAPGLGKGALHVAAMLLNLDGVIGAQKYSGATWEVGALAEVTRRSVQSVRKSLVRLIDAGLVNAQRVADSNRLEYALVPDAFNKAAALAPSMRTYGLADCREDRRLGSALAWINDSLTRVIEGKDREILEQRMETLAALRVPILTRLSQGEDEATILRRSWTYAPLYSAKHRRLVELGRAQPPVAWVPAKVSALHGGELLHKQHSVAYQEDQGYDRDRVLGIGGSDDLWGDRRRRRDVSWDVYRLAANGARSAAINRSAG